MCETTGYSYKYTNRLLTGSRKFKERKGRGPKYTDRDRAVLIRIWREAGCLWTTYFRASIGEWLREYRTCVAHVPDNMASHLLSMSASTMDRLHRGVARDKPRSMRRNRRSGRNGELLKALECKSGELVMGCDVPPGRRRRMEAIPPRESAQQAHPMDARKRNRLKRVCASDGSSHMRLRVHRMRVRGAFPAALKAARAASSASLPRPGKTLLTSALDISPT